jgi:hypothetical protein
VAVDVCTWKTITMVYNYMYCDLQTIWGVCSNNRPQG